MPPVKEQTLIALFLDAKCYEIDALTANKKKQLEVLAAYKKSLIYEYVTGKKEVPYDWSDNESYIRIRSENTTE